jgi:hypothetical protein
MVATGGGWSQRVKASMNWVYDRVVRHRCVNYHIWSATEGGSTVYALTRTAALAPRQVASYGSMEEVFRRTGVEVEKAAPGAARPYRPTPRPAVGLYRTSDGWAEVDYGHRTGAVPRELYERKEYMPPFDSLPKEAAVREPLPQQMQVQR